MGGPPYSPVGCANCTRRKIKVGPQKTECAKCLKQVALCLGFDKERGFLRRELRSEMTPSVEVMRPVRRLGLDPVFCDINGEIRTQLFSTFMDAFFTPNAKINGKDDSLYFLMATFPMLAGESELLDRSVIALVCSFLAIRSNNRALAFHGLKIYTSALSAMTRALRRSSGNGPHLLYASIIFHTYETLYNGDDALRSFFAHIQGASAIINSYNFKDKSTLPSAMLKRHKWAVAYCALNTKYGLQTDSKCLLIGDEDCPTNMLFRIIGHCAALRKDFHNACRLKTPEKEAALQELLERLRELQSLQTDWERLNIDTFSPQYGGQVLSKLQPPEEGIGLYPHEFKDLCTAKTYVLYRIASTVRYRLIYQSEKLLRGSSDPTDMLYSAGEICRSVAYCMRPSRQMSVGHMVLFSVSQASKAYIICGETHMFQWCQDIYSSVQAHGIGIASRVSKEDWALRLMTK